MTIWLVPSRKKFWEIKNQFIQPETFSLKYLHFEYFESQSITNCVKHSSRSQEYCKGIVLHNAYQDDVGVVPSFPREAKPWWALLVLAKEKRKANKLYWKGENKQDRVSDGKRNNISFQMLMSTTILALPFGLPASWSVWKPFDLGRGKNPKYPQLIKIKGDNVIASNGFTAEFSKAKETKEL